MNLHSLTLSFQGHQAHLEESYNRSVYENVKYLFEIRAVVFFAGVFYSLFGILDFLLVPDGYKPLLFIRLGVFLPLVVFVILFSYTPYFQRFLQFTLVSLIFVAGGGIIAMIVITPPPATYSYYAGLIIVFMFLYTFGRIRFIWATLAGWLLVALYEFCAITFTSAPLAVMINNNFFFICANFVGMASCYMIEFFDRKNFFINGQLESEKEKTKQINAELEQRVLDRTARLNDLNKNLKEEIERRRAFEDELTRIRDELEIRVEKRTTELMKANRELEKAKEIADASAKAKSQFLANMSHEIRTPMNAIIGMSDLAMNRGITQEQRNEYLGIIGKSARSLLGIINDILDLSKIEAGKLDFEIKPFRLREYVEGVTDMFFETIHAKGIEFIVDIASDIPETVKGDSLRLQQVLINLVSNALKFTDHGEICVRVKRGMMTETTVELFFDVIDTGIGIDLYKNFNLFDAFSQADGSITRKYGGTGLGLTICKRIITMMGGSIHVESEPGKGSTFGFNVVLERDHEKKHVLDMIGSQKTVKGLTVLSVMRNRSLQEVLVRMLTMFGMKCRMTDGFEQAMGMLEASGISAGGKPAFQILLMDEESLGTDHFEKLKILKDQGKLALPVILLGSPKTESDLENLGRKGVDALVTKPLKSSTILDSVMQVVYGPQLHSAPKETWHSRTDEFQGMKVLLVEDNPINQMVAIEILLLEGIQVSRASNGLEALEMIRENTFDAVLMDVQMPEMDGIEATRIIRGQMNIRPDVLPIIAMTAHVMQGDRERCLDAGMNDFVSKPIERHKLFSVLGNYVHKEKAENRDARETGKTQKHVEGFPEKLPGLDVAGGLKRLGCDADGYVDIIHQFCQFFEDYAQKFMEETHAISPETLARDLHSIKGSAANISAMTIHAITSRYETILEKEERCDVRAMAAELEDACRELRHSCHLLNDFHQNPDFRH